MRKYRSKRKSSTAKRRYRKRIYKKKAGPQASQAYVREKFRKVVAIEVGGSYGSARRISIPIGQFDKGNPPTGVTRVCFDKTERWEQTHVLYEQYAVKGMKVKFVPTNLNGTVNWHAGAAGNDFHTTYCAPIETWYDEDTYNAAGYSPLQRINLDSYRQYAPGRTFKRYFSNKGPTARAKSSWQDCQEWSSTIEFNENELPNNTFSLLFEAPGMPNEYTTVIGYLTVTHYVTFRGRQLGQIN